MWPFTKRRSAEIRADTEQMADIETATAEGQLLRAAVEARGEITIDKALMVPAVAACVRLISETVSMVPFRLYRTDQDDIQLKEIADDPRVALINADPKYKLKEGGRLCDICPTLIELMGMEQPKEMTGVSLLTE